MLRSTLFAATLFISFQTTAAHPPTTIAVNALGQVFYSDLQNIWMLDTDGSKHVVLRNVHTHVLWIDTEGNLLGEDVRNQGEDYRHRVWKIDTKGRVSNIIEWAAGHPHDIGGIETVRNHRNESVVLQRRERAIVVGRETANPQAISLAAIDGPIHELTIDPSGDIYVAVGKSIYLIEDGKDILSHYADVDLNRTDAFQFVRDHHALLGMHATGSDVYVTVFAGQRVLRIDEQRKVHDVVILPDNWSPVGVTTDSDGNLWILEFSSSNEARVSKVDGKGKRIVF